MKILVGQHELKIDKSFISSPLSNKSSLPLFFIIARCSAYKIERKKNEHR